MTRVVTEHGHVAPRVLAARVNTRGHVGHVINNVVLDVRVRVIPAPSHSALREQLSWKITVEIREIQRREQSRQ